MDNEGKQSQYTSLKNAGACEGYVRNRRVVRNAISVDRYLRKPNWVWKSKGWFSRNVAILEYIIFSNPLEHTGIFEMNL